MSNRVPLSEMLRDRPAVDDRFFDLCFDPEEMGDIQPKQKITRANLKTFNELVAEHEVPALRLFTVRHRRDEAAAGLDTARLEFGKLGFYVKAAHLGGMAARGFMGSGDYALAQALLQEAVVLEFRAMDSVIHPGGYIPEPYDRLKDPIRGNFPDLADPWRPKTGLKDLSSQETIYRMMQAHSAQLLDVLKARQAESLKKIFSESKSRLNSARFHMRDYNTGAQVPDDDPFDTNPLVGVVVKEVSIDY